MLNCPFSSYDFRCIKMAATKWLNDPLKGKQNAFRSTAELFSSLIYWMWKGSTSEMQIRFEFTDRPVTFYSELCVWIFRMVSRTSPTTCVHLARFPCATNLFIFSLTFHLCDEEYIISHCCYCLGKYWSTWAHWGFATSSVGCWPRTINHFVN